MNTTTELQEGAPRANSPEEIAKATLSHYHVSSFDNYLKAKYPNGIEKVPQEEIDNLFEAFCCGYNSAMFQTAADTLLLVGVNLSELTEAAKSK